MNYKALKCVFFLFLFISFTEIKAVQKNSHPFPLNQRLIKQIKNQGGALISNRVGEYILRAENLAMSKKYTKAIELLEYHYKRDTFSKAERAQFAMQLGYFYRQNKNNKKSLSYLQEALNLKALSYPQHLSVLYHLAQNHVEKENYNKALEILGLWFSINENPSPQAYILLAHCYYEKKQLSRALKYVEKTLSLVGKPMESWLQFAVAIYLRQKEYKKAEPYLEKLVALYPARASHWKQLAGVYLYLDKIDHAFITLDMANKMGHLKSESEFMNLSSLYIDQGMPYQGAKLLKSKIQKNIVQKKQKNLELLAEAFGLAREGEQALVYFKEASKKAVKALFFIKYGQRLLDEEKWSSAESVFKRALKTKEIQQTIEEIKNYKKEMALAERRKSDLQNQIFKQNKNFAGDKIVNKPEVDKPETVNAKQVELSLSKAPLTNRLESIYLGIGVSLYQQNKYEEALYYFKKSIEVDDTFLSGYQWIDYAETTLLEEKKKKSEKSI